MNPFFFLVKHSVVRPLLREQLFIGGEGKMLPGSLGVGTLTGISWLPQHTVLHQVWPGHRQRGR